MKHLLLFACLLSLPWFARAAASKPNILVITADDLGLQLGCYGDNSIRPPQLDAVARRESARNKGTPCLSPKRTNRLG